MKPGECCLLSIKGCLGARLSANVSQRLSILVSLKVVLPDQAFHELNLKPNTYLSLNLSHHPFTVPMLPWSAFTVLCFHAFVLFSPTEPMIPTLKEREMSVGIFSKPHKRLLLEKGFRPSSAQPAGSPP